MKAKTYFILNQCVERGVQRGYRRAHKHVENPTESAILDSVENCVMAEIVEYFSFDDHEFC